MARVQIEPPERLIYTTQMTVRTSDLNYGAHVGNDSVLTLMQEARVMLYRSLGLKDELSIDGSVGQIVTDAVVVYKSEAFLGDVLDVRIGLDDFSKYGFDMYYQLINHATGREVARGKTGIVCFDYDRRKISPVPPKFLEKLHSLLSQSP